MIGMMRSLVPPWYPFIPLLYQLFLLASPIQMYGDKQPNSRGTIPAILESADGAPLRLAAESGDAGQEISVRFGVFVTVNTSFVRWIGTKKDRTANSLLSSSEMVFLPTNPEFITQNRWHPPDISDAGGKRGFDFSVRDAGILANSTCELISACFGNANPLKIK